MTTLSSGAKTGLTKSPAVGAKRSTSATRLVLPIVSVAIVGLLIWLLGGLASGVDANAGLDRVTIQPRSFAIALKEKGELQATHSTDIKCEVEGRSTIISLILEGTPVQKGDLLVELASDEIEDRIRQEELKEANAITAYESAKTELEIQRDKNKSDIRKADLEIRLKQIELEKYQKGDWKQRLNDAHIAIEQAEMTLSRRAEDLEAQAELRKKNYTTKTDFEEAKFNHQKAEWDVEKAKQALTVLEQYTHVADLMKRESDLEEARKERDRVVKNAEAEEMKKAGQLEGKEKELNLIQDQLAKLRIQKEKCRIYSPAQGFVVYYTGGGRRWWSSEQQIKEGAEVYERQVLMQLPDTTAMKVTVRVHEAKTNLLKLGQQALVTVEGFPGQRFTGEVAKIAVVADSQSSWLNPDLKEYETEIALDPTDVPLKPGVTAHVEILVDTVDQELAVPVQSIFSRGENRYVFRDHGGEPEAVKVLLGGIGTEWAQIKSGVERGDIVFLAFSDEMKRLVPEPKRDDNHKWNGARNGRGAADRSGEQARRRPQPDSSSEGRPRKRSSRETKSGQSTAAGGSANNQSRGTP